MRPEDPRARAARERRTRILLAVTAGGVGLALVLGLLRIARDARAWREQVARPLRPWERHDV